MRAALVSESDWRAAIPRARARGADLICLPHLSFAPYVAASLDRSGLEHAERTPSQSVREGVALADGAWIAASAYESEGEGVFYVTAYLAAPGAVTASSRQRSLEASAGRYEQMFWSPGHTPPVACRLPCGSAVNLVGADLRSPDMWAAAADCEITHMIGATSEPAERFQRTRQIAAGMAAAHGLTVIVANRGDAGFAGEGAAFGPCGTALSPDQDGLYVV